MGAWGEDPEDNDIAADWFDSTLRVLMPAIEKGLESMEPEVVRAAALLVQLLGRVYVYPVDKFEDHVQSAIDALQEILADGEWINEWNSPESIHSSLKDQINALTAMQY